MLLKLYSFVSICISIAIYEQIPPWEPLPTMDELVARHGYSLERHFVTTSDGFVLEHHRIIINQTSNKQKRVVILNHGMQDSSNMWVLYTPGRSLGFYLADRGYDVWLLNTRGNAISRKHLTFTDKSANFWNHSWHEIAIYDLPITIDYIADLTKAKKVDFVGFSMGATTYFVLTSELPQYSEKINRVVAMAPGVFDVNLEKSDPITYYLITESLRVYSFAYSNGFVDAFEIRGSNCELNTVMGRIFCAAIKYVVGRMKYENIDEIEYKNAISYIFGSTSSLSFLHYYQNKVSGNFTKFDYGAEKNNEVYGKSTPPHYNLKKSKNPVAIFWSEDDTMCSIKGIERLLSALPNLSLNYKVPVPGFDHVDFFVARNTEHIVNEKIHNFFQDEH